MKTAALKLLRHKLSQDLPVFGLWVTLESPSVTEIAVGLGLDWVVIDAEHGHLDWKEIAEHLRATVRSDTVALVRISDLNIGLIKRALDIGADGIVIPWVETADQLQQAVAYCLYPPDGVRGIGGERATCWGQSLVEHTAEANENVLIVPIIETVKAVQNISQLCQVDGVELMFFGPADLSSTAGYRGQWEGPGVALQIQHAKDVIRQSGRHCGLLATSIENIVERQQQGFRAIGLGMDAGLLIRSIRSSLSAIGRDRSFQTSLIPAAPVATPLSRPPESMRPDRSEVMNPVGSGTKRELADGIDFECLVGPHNQARKLMTGMVTFEPGAVMPGHKHSFTESLTLLRGSVVVEVGGRVYRLKNLDNIVIPPGLAHALRNVSSNEPAVLHVALPTEKLDQTLVEMTFPRQIMPDDSTGVAGRERVNRIATAKRSVAGPNTEFIDCFNEKLTPGIEMSGGYGLFFPGGRLPAHVHDFDESICIISGTATCVVEGRQYSMTDCSTALQPRGRVHYFINRSSAPMEMIWVYAGPRPERIIVDERCATIEGNPWK